MLFIVRCRKVTAAAQEQLSKLWHTTHIYMHPKIHEYADKLASLFPGDLKVSLVVDAPG